MPIPALSPQSYSPSAICKIALHTPALTGMPVCCKHTRSHPAGLLSSPRRSCSCMQHLGFVCSCLGLHRCA